MFVVYALNTRYNTRLCMFASVRAARYISPGSGLEMPLLVRVLVVACCGML